MGHIFMHEAKHIHLRMLFALLRGTIKQNKLYCVKYPISFINDL